MSEADDVRAAVHTEAARAQIAVTALRAHITILLRDLALGRTRIDPARIHALEAATSTLELVVEALFAPGESTPAATRTEIRATREQEAAEEGARILHRPRAKAGP